MLLITRAIFKIFFAGSIVLAFVVINSCRSGVPKDVTSLNGFNKLQGLCLETVIDTSWWTPLSGISTLFGEVLPGQPVEAGYWIEPAGAVITVEEFSKAMAFDGPFVYSTGSLSSKTKGKIPVYVRDRRAPNLRPCVDRRSSRPR